MNAVLFALVLAATQTATDPVEAQNSAVRREDWVVTVVPEQKATLAVAEFTSGISLAARCVDGAYDLLIIGLPEAPSRETTRDLGLAVGDENGAHHTVWTVGDDRTTAFSRLPAMVARRLAKGGKLQIVAQGSDERRYRYVMDINPSSTAIEQTLTACGRPLVDPRDKETEGDGRGLPPTIEWRILPRPQFPGPVNGRWPSEGYAVLSCAILPDGRLNECQTESESPRGYGLSREALRSIDRARVQLTQEGVTTGRRVEDGLITFSIYFKLQ
jgi:hypothetical protein